MHFAQKKCLSFKSLCAIDDELPVKLIENKEWNEPNWIRCEQKWNAKKI